MSRNPLIWKEDQLGSSRSSQMSFVSLFNSSHIMELGMGETSGPARVHVQKVAKDQAQEDQNEDLPAPITHAHVISARGFQQIKTGTLGIEMHRICCFQPFNWLLN